MCEYKLCKTADPKTWLWATFAPSGHTFGPPTFQLTLSVRGRSAKNNTPLLATGSTRPLATVTLAGEAFPLTIGWHERKRGGALLFGGERRTGIGGGTLCWQMAWTPAKDVPGVFDVQLRVQSSPRRTGDLTLTLPVALFHPLLHNLPSAAAHGHCAGSVFSEYGKSSVWLAATEGAADWDAEANGWNLAFRRFPMGGSKTVRFSVGMTPAGNADAVRPLLVKTYARLAAQSLHTLASFPALDPARPLALLTDAARYASPGTERLYFQPPGADVQNGLTAWAGAPFYPLDGLKTLADRTCLHPHPDAPRFVRFGAAGIAADCQVMGREGLPQPNKGAFWDKAVNGWGKNEHGEPLHGIKSNARQARALFLLHASTGDALLRQSALNICQWLMLKSNERGFWDGAFVHATQGTEQDGKVVPQPGAWDGADAIRAFVLAFRATRNEVYIKAAWKVAHVLLERLPAEGDALPAQTLATIALNLLALNAEADNPHLRQALDICGSLLLPAPLPANGDGLHSDGFECAAASFALHSLTRHLPLLRYGLCALAAVPEASRETSWRAIETYHAALLSVCGLIADARPDPAALSVLMDWRTFAPDPATDQFVSIVADGPVWTLPLVCRASSQLLVLALAPPDVKGFQLMTGKRCSPVFDLLTGKREPAPVLHPLGGKTAWARAAALTVDP